MKNTPLTARQEANALVALVFRNGFLEDLHAGKSSEILKDPSYSRITDAEMKQLMIETSALLAKLLEKKESNPDEYWKLIQFAHSSYAKNWDTTTDVDTARRNRERFSRPDSNERSTDRKS